MYVSFLVIFMSCDFDRGKIKMKLGTTVNKKRQKSKQPQKTGQEQEATVLEELSARF